MRRGVRVEEAVERGVEVVFGARLQQLDAIEPSRFSF